MTEFLSEHIRGFIRIQNVFGVKDQRVLDVSCGIIFLDPVTTSHFSQFQLMRQHCRIRISPVLVWRAEFRTHIGQIADKTHDQQNYWRLDYPRAFGYKVNCSNPHTNSSGQVKRTGDHFTLYSSCDLRATIETPCCQQYKPGDFPAGRPPDCDMIIHRNDDDGKGADPRAGSGGTSRHCDGNNNGEGEAEDEPKRGANETGKRK